MAPAHQGQAGKRPGIPSMDNLGSAGASDSRTGAQNTATLTTSAMRSSTDSQNITGSPGAEYCADLTFEGQNDYFLPNKEELAAIIAEKNAIDAADDTSGSKFSNIGGSYIWSSSESSSNGHAWRQRPSDGYQHSNDRHNEYWVCPCRRFNL